MIKTTRGVLVHVENDRETAIAFQEWLLKRNRETLGRHFGDGHFISCGGQHYVGFFDDVDAFEIVAWLNERKDNEGEPGGG